MGGKTSSSAEGAASFCKTWDWRVCISLEGGFQERILTMMRTKSGIVIRRLKDSKDWNIWVLLSLGGSFLEGQNMQPQGGAFRSAYLRISQKWGKKSREFLGEEKGFSAGGNLKNKFHNHLP